VHPRHHVWITLEQRHIEVADKAALARRNAAREHNRKPVNGAPIEHNAGLKIDILGCRCEAAAKLWANPVEWHAFAERVTDLPDLHDFIDVKGIDHGWHSLIVQKGSPKDWAYLLVNGEEHPRYCIMGWVWGHEAKQEQFWGDPKGGRPAYFIRQHNPILKPPAELLVELRKRQGLPSEETTPEEKRAWGAYWAAPGDETLHEALAVTRCIQAAARAHKVARHVLELSPS
jgi:hypothetical protein